MALCFLRIAMSGPMKSIVSWMCFFLATKSRSGTLQSQSPIQARSSAAISRSLWSTISSISTRNGKYASGVNNRWPTGRNAALTIVDERPQKVDTNQILLSDAEKGREALMDTHPEIEEQVDKLAPVYGGLQLRCDQQNLSPKGRERQTRMVYYGDSRSVIEIGHLTSSWHLAWEKPLPKTAALIVSDGTLVRFGGYST